MENKPVKKGQGVSLTASPAKTIRDGQRVAKVLVDIVTQNKWSVKIGNNDYLQFEAWQTIAQFYGFAVSTSEVPEPVKFGEVEGFQAKATVIDKRTGLVVGGATALCMNDESNWSKKPLFQLSSMAQTRAGSKALRNMFSWVVVLAGYKPTPAEEMQGEDVKKELPKENREQEVPLATEKQVNLLKDFVEQGRIEDKDFAKLTIKEASDLIAAGFKTKPKIIEGVAGEGY